MARLSSLLILQCEARVSVSSSSGDFMRIGARRATSAGLRLLSQVVEISSTNTSRREGIVLASRSNE